MSNSPTPAPAGTGTAEPYSGKVLDAAKLEALLGEARYMAEKPRRPGRSAIMANTEASWARSLLDAVATLTRQLAEAQQDTARLDWLERERPRVGLGEDGEARLFARTEWGRCSEARERSVKPSTPPAFRPLPTEKDDHDNR